MNNPYNFTFRRHFFKRTITVVGHSYLQEQDKMILYFADGSVRELVKWSKCEVFLGLDWVSAVRAQFNKDAQRGE